ncbi:MAG: hypothetical protein HQ522_13300 [Bacteroidetes bacterium]|nr:hypothetical protein [Bacteroidota bacterium]
MNVSDEENTLDIQLALDVADYAGERGLLNITMIIWQWHRLQIPPSEGFLLAKTEKTPARINYPEAESSG